MPDLDQGPRAGPTRSAGGAARRGPPGPGGGSGGGGEGEDRGGGGTERGGAGGGRGLWGRGQQNFQRLLQVRQVTNVVIGSSEDLVCIWKYVVFVPLHFPQVNMPVIRMPPFFMAQPWSISSIASWRNLFLCAIFSSLAISSAFRPGTSFGL